MTRGKPTPHTSKTLVTPRFIRPSARSVAMAVLQEVERNNVFADESLDHALAQARLDGRDRALAVELVYGVLRHRSTLDWRLGQVSDRSIERLPFLVRAALRIGSYQLLYLHRVPASAAVNESVTLVKRRSGQHWAGFVNAVLRALGSTPAPAWPDSTRDPAFAFAVRYGCPQWLSRRWIDRFGAEQAESLCKATTSIPPLTLRVNTLRVTRERLLQEFLKDGCEARPTQVSATGLIVEKRGLVTGLPLFSEGAFYVEDEAGQLVPPILDPQPGERVLDACAAPGGKATHLAALMQNRGEIIALDRSPARLRLLEENCRRLGVQIVTTMQADAAQAIPSFTDDRSRSSRLPSALAVPFDRILLDAPCSGLGVLRRHPEGKWQKAEDLLARHQAMQVRLLDRISRALRPGGVLVYSICSTEPEENEQVVAQFLEQHPEFSPESVATWLPPAGQALMNAEGDLSTMFSPYSMDGFFAARLRKVSA